MGGLVKKILFLCTGNYYRSRYAEAYMKHLSSLLKLGVDCTSAGFEISKADKLSNMYGEISPFTKKRLVDQQIFNLASEIRTELNNSLLLMSDKIIIIDKEEHTKYLCDYSAIKDMDVVYWNAKDIQDWAPKITLDLIEINCQNLASEIWNDKF